MRQRVGGAAFDGGGQGQDRRGAEIAERDQVGHFGLTLGDGAGLVEGDGFEATEVFQVGAAFDQDAVAGGLGDAGQDGGGGAQGQGAGGGGDQQGHGAQEGFAKGDAKEGREGDQQEIGYQHGGDEDALEFLGQLLGGGFLGLGLFDHFHDARQGAVFRQAGDAALPGRLAVDGAGEDLGAGGLIDRDGFAGDRRLVDAGLPGEHQPIDRQAHAGADGDDIFQGELLDRQLDFAGGALDQGGLGGQVGQGTHGGAGVLQGALFEGVPEAEEEEQQGAFGPGAQEGGAQGGGGHQQIGVEMALAQGMPGVVGDLPAAKEVGGDVEGVGDEQIEPEEGVTQPAQQHEQPGQQAVEHFLVVFVPAAHAFDRDFVAERADALFNGGTVDFMPVEFDADGLGDVADADGQHAVDATQAVLDDGGAVGAIHAFDGYHHMVVVSDDLGAGLGGEAADLFDRQEVRVVMQAQVDGHFFAFQVGVGDVCCFCSSASRRTSGRERCLSGFAGRLRGAPGSCRFGLRRLAGAGGFVARWFVRCSMSCPKYKDWIGGMGPRADGTDKLDIMS